MTNYTKTTDFAAKDALPSGNSAKIVKGTEIDTEFNNIATSSATKANSNNSALTGTTTFETISDGAIAITAFVDEDNMASNSATLVPTQQSVKAYVDSQVTAQDLDFQADTGGALSIDLDSETLTFTGGTGIDTSGSGNAVTFAIDSTVATQTQLNAKAPLASPTFTGTVTVPGLTTTANVLFGDDDKAIFGAGSDLSIYHDGFNSYIDEGGNGDLRIRSGNVFLDKYTGETMLHADADGAVTAYFDNAAKLATTATGIDVTGVITTDGMTTSADINFGDNNKAIFGAGSDLEIYHDATLGSFIKDVGTGDLILQGGNDVRVQDSNGTELTRFNEGAGVDIKHNGTTKLATTSTGIDVTGTTDTDNLTIAGAQGTSGQVLTSSGSGVSWADASGGIDTFNVTGVQSNRFYSGLYETDTAATFTLSTTTIYYLPFVVWEDCTIDGFATSINGGTGNSGDVAQIAIYGPLPSSMSNVPHKITTSTFAVDSGYGKTVSITPTAFTKGVYFYAIAANTSSLAIRAFETPKRYINYMVGVGFNASTGGVYDAQYSQNTVSTWPHTFQTQISSPTQANHHTDAVPHFQYLVQ